MLQPVQVFGIIIAVIGVIHAIMLLRRAALSRAVCLFWLLVWVGVGCVALFPEVLSAISLSLGIGRGIDVAVYAAVILLFYLVFRIVLKLERLEKTITTLVREIALQGKK